MLGVEWLKKKFISWMLSRYVGRYAPPFVAVAARSGFRVQGSGFCVQGSGFRV
jgi:hypothetical protein